MTVTEKRKALYRKANDLDFDPGKVGVYGESDQWIEFDGVHFAKAVGPHAVCKAWVAMEPNKDGKIVVVVHVQTEYRLRKTDYYFDDKGEAASFALSRINKAAGF